MLVRDAMTPRPVTVAPDANVRAALSVLRRGRFRHLPVVAGEELVWVVTAADLEPANLFAARVGDRVPPERRAAFSGRLERATSSSSSE